MGRETALALIGCLFTLSFDKGLAHVITGLHAFIYYYRCTKSSSCLCQCSLQDLWNWMQSYWLNVKYKLHTCLKVLFVFHLNEILGAIDKIRWIAYNLLTQIKMQMFKAWDSYLSFHLVIPLIPNVFLIWFVLFCLWNAVSKKNFSDVT